MPTITARYFPTAYSNLVVTTLLLSLALSGCAVSPPRVDFNATPPMSSAPHTLPDGPVALVLSAQTEQTQRDMAAYQNYYRHGRLSWLYAKAIRTAYIETSDPGFSAQNVEQIMTQRFDGLQKMQSLSRAKASGLPLIVVLDVQTKLINNRSSEPASALTLFFYDTDLKPLGTLTALSQRDLSPMWAGSKHRSEIVSDIREQGEVQAMALQSLQEQLAAVPSQ